MEQWLKINQQETELKKKIKTADNALDKAAYKRYATLGEDEVKKLVIDDKWFGSLRQMIDDEISGIVQGFISGVQTLCNRYETPLENIVADVETYCNKVTQHLDTIQQLLTGKIRLSGFSGEWELKRLDKIGKFQSAGVNKKIIKNEQPIRLLNYLDVYKKNTIYSNDINHWVTAPSYQINKCSIKKGDIFFTPSSEVRDDIGQSAVAMEDMPDVCYSYHIVRFRLYDDWDLNFSAYVFQTYNFLQQASVACDGSGTRYVISQNKFRNMQIWVPSKPEQIAIGNILADMDKEITALEEQLAKAKQIKQGMMNNLLTGKIRLI